MLLLIVLVTSAKQPETLVCTSTMVWRWGHTSTTSCRHVMVHWYSETAQVD